MNVGYYFRNENDLAVGHKKEKKKNFLPNQKKCVSLQFVSLKRNLFN